MFRSSLDPNEEFTNVAPTTSESNDLPATTTTVHDNIDEFSVIIKNTDSRPSTSRSASASSPTPEIIDLAPNEELEILQPDVTTQPDLTQSEEADALGVQNFDDPADFANKKLRSEEINVCLKLENQPLSSMTFPSTSGRRFNPAWKNIALSNGTTKSRDWLVYSIKNDSVFCLHCTLFCLPNDINSWATTGCKVWTSRHGEQRIEHHEKSKAHISSQIARIQWLSQKRIDHALDQVHDDRVHHNREVLSAVIDCCRYLAEEMMAFRKKDFSKGKLFKLFKLLAKYNPDVRVYYDKIEKSKSQHGKLSSNFLSYRNVYDVVSVMNDLIIQRIVSDIKYSNTYSVILDSTQDISKKECTAVLVRYVEHLDENGDQKNEVKPQERLVKVFTTGDTTGGNLAKELLTTLTTLGIDLSGMVGQSMDGASNMRGRYSGLKSLVLKECPKALYVLCCSHRFALVVEQSIDISPHMRNMFSLLQEMYVFMSGHRRHHMFLENLAKEGSTKKKKSLKRVQTTRWSSRSEALKTVFSCFTAIKETLEDIIADQKSDTETKASARGIIKGMTDYSNICAMHVAAAIFKVLSPITTCLQAKSIDYGVIPAVMNDTKSKLEKLRSEEEWDNIRGSVDMFLSLHNISDVPMPRNRKRKRFMDELSLDERPQEPAKRMRVETYFPVLDSLIGQVNDRFPELSTKLLVQMSFFSHGGVLKMSEEAERRKHFSTESIKDLCDYYGLDEVLVASELEAFSPIYKATHKNISVSDLCEKSEEPVPEAEEVTSDVEERGENDDRMLDQWVLRGFVKPYRCVLHLSSLPNLTVLYRILLSLAVTSCSAERAMSRLKIVKNRLRSSMGDSWLSNLLVLSRESDILENIENNEIIEAFAKTTTQRRKLLLYKRSC